MSCGRALFPGSNRPFGRIALEDKPYQMEGWLYKIGSMFKVRGARVFVPVTRQGPWPLMTLRLESEGSLVRLEGQLPVFVPP